jgi:PmbA protein
MRGNAWIELEVCMEKQIELIERNLEVTRVGCKFNRVKAIEQQSFRGRAARAIANGRLGYMSTTDGLADDDLIKRATANARVAAPPALVFPNAIITSESIDPALARLTGTQLRDIARQIIRTIKGNKPDLSIELELRRVREQVQLRNSNGGEARQSRIWLEGEAWVERHNGHDVLVALDSFSTAHLDGSQLEFARRMARRLRWAKNTVEPESGKQSVILSPTAFASLLGPMLYAFNGVHARLSGSRANKRRTGFATKIGRQEFDSHFSLYDDAPLPDRPHSTQVDHEGTPAQRTLLVERGIVAGLYHNLISAAQAETRSTGNGFRDLVDPPLPSPTNVRVARGEMNLSDVLKNLDAGLLIDLVGGSDASIGLNGDFSRTIVLAYQIKRGRVVGYVRGAGLSGDLYKSLQRIEALSCDGYWSGDIFAPYIQLGGVTISV